MKTSEHWTFALRIGAAITYIPLRIIGCIADFIIGLVAGICVGVEEDINNIRHFKDYV